MPYVEHSTIVVGVFSHRTQGIASRPPYITFLRHFQPGSFPFYRPGRDLSVKACIHVLSFRWIHVLTKAPTLLFPGHRIRHFSR